MAFALLALVALFVPFLSHFQPLASISQTRSLATSVLAANVPFEDGFEAATLGADWTTTVGNQGIVEVTSDYFYSGTQGIFLGQKVSGSASASLILSAELAGKTDVFLDFWVRSTGTDEVRRVSISDDGGASWTEIWNLDDVSQTFSHIPVDLTDVAANTGRSLNNNFRIRFTYSNDSTIGQAGDGMVIDAVRLTSRVNTIATFPLAEESFEDSAFGKGFNPRSFNNGFVELSADYPRSGTRSVVLGQRVSGSASASLVLAIDLTAQNDVFLNFWARSTGSGESRRVYVSDNNGASWVEVLDIDDASVSFSHFLIDLSSAAVTKGFALNRKFLIRFTYSNDSTVGDAGDGLVIDDIRLTDRSGVVANFPLAQDSFETTALAQGLFPNSYRNGVAERSTDYPYTGSYGLFLGQKVSGSASASLVLAVNLSTNTDVFLDFRVRSTGTGETRRVYISDNSGASWIEILNLDRVSQEFRHEVVNLRDLAATKGFTLNAKSLIRFTYANDSTVGDAGDGMVIDDVRLSTSNPVSKVFLPMLRR